MTTPTTHDHAPDPPPEVREVTAAVYHRLRRWRSERLGEDAEVTVGEGSPLARYGVTEVWGAPVNVDGSIVLGVGPDAKTPPPGWFMVHAADDPDPLGADDLGRAVSTSGLTPEARAALSRHGYDPDLPPRGISGPPEVLEVYQIGDDGEVRTVPARNHVCVLDGVEVDGHEGSDLDPASTSCIHCDYQGPRP